MALQNSAGGNLLIDAYLTILSYFLAFTIGYLYYYITYACSIFIYPLKAVIEDFCNTGSNRSALIISCVSGTIISIVIIVHDCYTTYFFTSWPIRIGLYFGYIFFGYFALFLLADIQMKSKK